MENTESDILGSLAALRSGGILLYPTDTVWGLGCDPTDAAAVDRLFALKHRPDGKAMLLLAADARMVSEYTGCSEEEIEARTSGTDRPVTVIYPGAHGVDGALIAPDGSIGIRIPRDGFCLRLCREFGRPIVSTSANISGEPAPAAFSGISPDIANAADYVCGSGRDRQPGHPSRILKIMPDGSVTVIRE